MAFFSHAVSTRAPAAGRAAPKRGFLARLYAALLMSRQRTVERALGRYLKNNSKLTDRIERDIEQRFLPRPGFQVERDR
ncbi:MAG TPA: hypothetical protein VHD14_12620 [Pseudolabrys sp.]|nr:hypothetical protein [Pseudolabrys sp.]